MEHRASEVEQARSLVLASQDLGKIIDPKRVVAGGFSFGAATAGLVAATTKNYCAAVLIDGWWHIELTKKAKVNQDLPTQVHSRGIAVPTLFVGSTEFSELNALNRATKNVQAKCPTKEIHVLPGTRHGNYMDAVFWFPAFVTQRFGFAGPAHVHTTYAHFVRTIADFVDRHAASTEKKNA